MSEKNTVLIDGLEDEEENNIPEAEILGETKAQIILNEDEKAKELSGINKLLANLPTDSDVSIIVTRLRDRQYKGEFRLHCNIDSKVDVVTWDNEPYPDSIYDYITKKHGGGQYRFQLRYNGGFKEAWTDVLADSAEPSEKEKLLIEQSKAKEPVKIETPPINFQPQITEPKPMTQEDFLRNFIEQKKLEKELADLLAPAPQTTQVQETESKERSTNKLDFLMDIYRETKEEGLRNKIVNATLGVTDPKSEVLKRSWMETIADTFASSPTLQNKAGQIMDGVISLATIAFTPKMPTQTPPVDINAFRQPRNDAPVSPPETPPETAQPVQNEPVSFDNPIPFIAIGEKQND